MDPNSDARPVVIVLGDFAHEGLSAKIESLGYSVINKRFRSSPKNWLKIAEIVRELKESGRLALIFGYIPTPTLLLLAEHGYDDVREVLFSELASARSIFFVYETNLRGEVDPIPWEVDYYATEIDMEVNDLPWRVEDEGEIEGVREEAKDRWFEDNEKQIGRALEILESWERANIEVLPFKKRSDVTIRMFEALEDVQAGVFLRLYVPHGRYQSEQLEDFITLFTRYLRDIEGKEFSVDFQRTSRGTTYVFKGRGDIGSVAELREATSRFDQFLVIAQNDPNAAEKALSHTNIPPEQAGFIVAKFARSFRRLRLEVQHDFERKRLILNQQLEAELLDANEANLLPRPPDEHLSALFSVVGNTAPVTINLAAGAISSNSQITVERSLMGGIHYTAEDKAILELLSQMKDEVAALQLRSDLDRLKDPAISPEEHRTTAQKLKGFLYKVARKADHVATEVLISYINSLVQPPK